tara:strand:- start:5588 stop:5794 length:207 start_codon:yes stop_codon:yes gene_type:complete
MYYDKSKIELIGIVLEQDKELIELRKQKRFYKRKYQECNEWGSGEEYMSGSVPLKKLLPVLGINKKLK